MTASSLPCPSCRQVLTFGAAPAPGQSFKCPKCHAIVQSPSPAPTPSGRPAKQRANRGTGAKPAAVRKASESAFSFVEQDRIESATAPPRKRGAGLLILAIVGFLFLLLGMGGGGYATLYFTGALSHKPAAPVASTPGDLSRPPDAPPTAPASRSPLIGRWELQGADPALFTEFRDDGSLVSGGGDQRMKGAWKPVDDTTLEIVLDIPGKAALKRRLKFQVDKDRLTLTDEQNQVDVFTRTGAKPSPP